jgi:outer membrane protein assembly factor BamE
MRNMPESTITRAGRHASLLLCAIVLLAGSGCSMKMPSMEGVEIPGVYRLDVPQGNVIKDEDLRKLERGMSKRKVRFLLGTPAIVDVFNQERWDYIYLYRTGGGDETRRTVSVYFADERLERIAGDFDPDSGPANTLAARERVVDVPKGRGDGSILGKLLGTREALPVSTTTKPEVATAAPSGKDATETAKPTSDAPEQVAAAESPTSAEPESKPPEPDRAATATKEAPVESESFYERMKRTFSLEGSPVDETGEPIGAQDDVTVPDGR